MYKIKFIQYISLQPLLLGFAQEPVNFATTGTNPSECSKFVFVFKPHCHFWSYSIVRNVLVVTILHSFLVYGKGKTYNGRNLQIYPLKNWYNGFQPNCSTLAFHNLAIRGAIGSSGVILEVTVRLKLRT